MKADMGCLTNDVRWTITLLCICAPWERDCAILEEPRVLRDARLADICDLVAVNIKQHI